MSQQINTKQQSCYDHITVGGITYLTTIDYPGKMSAVVFCQGCPFKCLFCHNKHLQCFDENSDLKWGKILKTLDERKGFLDAVVFSGGEPTLQPSLNYAMNEVRDMGFLVGLHTAGPSPSLLENVLDLCDYVALDIKATKSKYRDITNHDSSGRLAYESLSTLVDNHKNFEVRTTVYPNILNEDDILEIAYSIKEIGAKTYVLQQYRPIHSEEYFTSLKKIISDETLKTLSLMFETFYIRE